MEEKQLGQRRAFTAEYKAEVVALCRSGDKSIARDLDIKSVRQLGAMLMAKQRRNLKEKLKRVSGPYLEGEKKRPRSPRPRSRRITWIWIEPLCAA